MQSYQTELPHRRPLQRGDPVTANWTRVNELDADLLTLQDQIAQLRREVAANRSPRASLNHFPFRIYALPDYLRTAADLANDWRKVCVRGGTVFVDWVAVTATGTDGETFPDQDSFPLTAGHSTNEILCPLNVAQYWIWLEITATTAVVNHGAAAPVWSSAIVPLGWVDTTAVADQMAHVRQLVRTDFFTCL